MEPEEGGPGGVQQTDAACRLSRWPAAGGHHDAISGCSPQGPAACGQEAAAATEAAKLQQQQHATGARDAATAGSKPDTTATATAASNCKAPSALPSDCQRAADQQQQQLQAAAAAACDMQLDVAEAADDGSDGEGVSVTRQRSLRGWQAMMFSPRQAPSGPLELPSPREAAAGASSPEQHSTHDDGLPSPAAAAALLQLPLLGSSCHEQQHDGMDVDPPAADAAAAAPAAVPALLAAARPTLVIPASPAPGCPSTTDSPLAVYTPGGSLVRPYSGPRLCVDELDLDAIDDISGLDSSGGLSNSSSPIVSGASGGGYSGGRGTPGSSHLRSSRDHDLRRAALMNQLLSPRPQQPGGSAAAVTAVSPGSLSVQVEGPGHVPMFTGSTRARALQQLPGGGGGSSSSLHSSAAASPAGSEPAAQPPSMMQLMYSMRVPRGGGTSPSPVRPSSSLAAAAAVAMPPPAHRPPGSARASSVPSSPAPAPAHGHAAALLAGSVLASPRTPHSPLSVALSPRPCSSTRALLAPGSVLPAPAFSSGVCDAAPHGATPGTSPGTSSVAAPSSTTSSCHAGQLAGAQMRGSLPSPAASRFGPQQACLSSLPRVGSDGDLLQPHQQQPQPQPLTAEQLQQLHLLAQVQQHDTRFGPHGGSPLSPSHHHQQQPQPQRGGRGLLSPTRPSPQVPPAMMMLSLADGQLAAAAPLAFAPAAAAARAAADTTAAGAAAPVGELGRDSIHEWLDHHSWRLRPDELPVGLRDAADLRDSAAAAAAAAARDTQAHTHQQQQQQLGDGRTHSRASSHRSSLSQVELPLTSLGLLPAAVSTAHWYAQQQQHGGPLSPAPGSYVQQHQQRTPMSSHCMAVQPAACSTPEAASGAGGGDWHGHSTAGAAAPEASLQELEAAHPAASLSRQLAPSHSWPATAAGGHRARPAAATATAVPGRRQQQLAAAHEPQRQHTRLQHVRPASLAVAGAAAAPDDDPDLHLGARLPSERLDAAAHVGSDQQQHDGCGSGCTQAAAPGAHQQHRTSSSGLHGGFAPGLGRAASGRGVGDASPYGSSSFGVATAAGDRPGASSSGSIRSRLGPAACGVAGCSDIRGASDCAAASTPGAAPASRAAAGLVLSPGRRPYIAGSPVAQGLAAGAQWLQPPPRPAPDVLPGIELLLQRRPRHQQHTVVGDSSDDGFDDDDRDEGGTLGAASRCADGHSNVQGGGGGGMHTPQVPGCPHRQPHSGGLGGLLHDDGFVGRLLLSLPGVEAGAAAVQAALAELREAHPAAGLLSEPS